MSNLLNISLVDGSTMVVREDRKASKMARSMDKKGFIETLLVETPDDEGTSIVLLRGSVLAMSPYKISLVQSGLVKVTSVPSKTRN